MNFVDFILKISSDPDSEMAKEFIKIITNTKLSDDACASALAALFNKNKYNIDLDECKKIVKARHNIGQLIAGNLKY